METFPLAGVLRRIRRVADLSQRELAERIGSSRTTIAAAECGARELPVSVLTRAAGVIGARLAVLDPAGAELAPMDEHAVRDRGDRRFPAHLDTRHGDIDWWHGPERYSRERPTYTFDRDRDLRDVWRQRNGTPPDHQLPQPGDSPAQRAAERRRKILRHEAEERQRRFLAGELRHLPDAFTCACPPGCDYAEGANEDLHHTAECACRYDVG